MGRPKKPITADCPCGGKENWTWHRRHRLPQCQKSIENNTIKKHTAWIPGTSIYLPEYEEP
jgi:hypothetical protein